MRLVFISGVCVCVCIRSVVQSCQTLSTLMDCSPPGSSVHEIVQARVLECISISYSKAQSQLSYLKSKVCRPSEGRWAETNSYNLLHFAFSIANASNLPNLWSNRCPEKLGELCGISQVIFFFNGCFHYRNSSCILSENESTSNSVLFNSLPPMECSLPGISVHGILQARILEWVAIPFSSASSWPRDQTQVPCIAGLFFTIWVTRELLKSKR